MAETHFFDTRIAELYGVNCAVILQNLWHWIRKNEANEKNFHDGTYWTYNSTKAFSELFPYLSHKQVKTALKRLQDEGIVVTGNYNALKYDRTLWYAITPKGRIILLGEAGDKREHSICPTGKMEKPSRVNGFDTEGQPIPDINTNINSDRNSYISIVSYLNERAGTAYKHTTPKTQAAIKARLAEGFTEEDFFTVIDKKCSEWLGDSKMERYLRPETLFGTKFEGYLNARVCKQNEPRIPDGIRNRVSDVDNW